MTKTNFILSLFHHGFKVRWTTAYFVLIGKRTNSVLTYAACYHLLPFFHLFPKMKKEAFYSEIETLLQQEWLSMDEKNFVQITPRGKQQVDQLDLNCVDKMNRYYDYQVKENVFRRFLLTIQLVSEKSYANCQYCAVESKLSLQQQVAYQWKNTHASFSEVKAGVYKELVDLLKTFPQPLAYITIFQLSGHHITAKTSDQLADLLCCPLFEVELYIEQLKSRLCQLSQTSYPWLYYFIMPQLNPISFQSQKIKEGIEQGKSIKVMSEQLHKKEGTIFDYVVEWAIEESNFPFSKFISKEDHQRLMQYYHCHPNVGLWDYKEIRKQYEELSFHSFRLFQIKEGLRC